MELLNRFKTVPGTLYGTPKEVWGFRTKPHRGQPARIAHDFLKANKKMLALEGIRLRRTRTIESLGADHVIHQQRLKRIPIHRAYVTVHMGRDGRIYLVKNRAVPKELLEPAAKFKVTKASARKKGLHSATKRPRLAKIIACEQMWFPLKSKLRPAYRVRVRSLKPRGDWIIFVDGETGRILRKYDNLAEATGVASVFDPNPVIALGGPGELFYDGHEAAAMGEGFGDYFSASFFADKKTQYYRTSVGTWDGIKDTAHDPPCVRRVDEKLTYESFDHGENADEHDNGQIWSATLWDIRTAIQPEIADRIILESHFQLDGFTTFARGARAIIDADRNLNRGRHLARLRQLFHRRGIGPVE